MLNKKIEQLDIIKIEKTNNVSYDIHLPACVLTFCFVKSRLNQIIAIKLTVKKVFIENLQNTYCTQFIKFQNALIEMDEYQTEFWLNNYYKRKVLIEKL